MATETQGEHEFPIEILVSGEAVSGFSASETLTAGEPVVVDGDNEVSAAADGGPGSGVAAYDVASGEQVAVIMADGDNEVRLEVSEAVDANDELTPDGLGTVRQTVGADPDETLGIANAGAGSGEVVVARLTEQQGVTA